MSFYLKCLLENDVLLRKHKVGYINIYTIKDPDKVEKILMAYSSSFLDRLVDKMDEHLDGEPLRQKQSTEDKLN